MRVVAERDQNCASVPGRFELDAAPAVHSNVPPGKLRGLGENVGEDIFGPGGVATNGRVLAIVLEAAAEEFLAVRGRLAATAIRELCEMYEETGEPERAVELLREQLKKTETKAERIVLFNTIADVYERAGQIDNAIAALRELAGEVTYEEAMKIQEAEPRPSAPERDFPMLNFPVAPMPDPPAPPGAEPGRP